MILETERLYLRPLSESDLPAFSELMGDPRVMDPIPQKILSPTESQAKLRELMFLEKTSSTRIWCLCLKGGEELTGIAGVLKNEEAEDEIAFRLLAGFWGHGYGTEIARGLIEHCFTRLHSTKVTADVCVENGRSVKVLSKFFTARNEFYNREDRCMDRRYVLSKAQWQARQQD